MKGLVIFIILLIITIPVSFAKEINIPELFEVEKQIVSKTFGKEVHYYAGSKLIAVNDEYKYQDRLGSDVNSKSLPFGQPLVIENRFSFTGKELDEDLHYFNARYYDSNLGKFTSMDPVEENHAYSYVRNDPMNLIDPDGEDFRYPEGGIFEGPPTFEGPLLFEDRLIDFTKSEVNSLDSNSFSKENIYPFNFGTDYYISEKEYSGNFLKKGVAGTAGGLIAVGVIAIIYPERGGLPNEFSSIQHIKESGDLFQHTLGGGIITTVVGSLTNPKLGLISGVSVGLLKEVIDYSDGDLGSHAQLSDFLATAAGSLASYILQDYVDSKFKITENSIALDFNF